MYVCIFLSVSLIIYILFAVCTTTTVQYSNQGINIKSRIRVLNCYYANKFILKSCIIYCRIYGVIIFLIGVFPIHDDHCKLTLTTSTSSFVSRTFFSFTPRVSRRFDKELHPVVIITYLLFFVFADTVTIFLSGIDQIDDNYDDDTLFCDIYTDVTISE